MIRTTPKLLSALLMIAVSPSATLAEERQSISLESSAPGPNCEIVFANADESISVSLVLFPTRSQSLSRIEFHQEDWMLPSEPIGSIEFYQGKGDGRMEEPFAVTRADFSKSDAVKWLPDQQKLWVIDRQLRANSRPGESYSWMPFAVNSVSIDFTFPGTSREFVLENPKAALQPAFTCLQQK